MTFVDPGGRAGDELLVAVAGSLSGRLAEIAQDVTEHLAAVIEQLRGDAAILGVLGASVTENIAAVFHVYEHGMPVENIENCLEEPVRAQHAGGDDIHDGDALFGSDSLESRAAMRRQGGDPCSFVLRIA